MVTQAGRTWLEGSGSACWVLGSCQSRACTETLFPHPCTEGKGWAPGRPGGEWEAFPGAQSLDHTAEGLLYIWHLEIFLDKYVFIYVTCVLSKLFTCKSHNVIMKLGMLSTFYRWEPEIKEVNKLSDVHTATEWQLGWEPSSWPRAVLCTPFFLEREFSPLRLCLAWVLLQPWISVVRTPILFSIVAAPIYIPTNSAQRFTFLHILVNTYYFLFFW